MAGDPNERLVAVVDADFVGPSALIALDRRLDRLRELRVEVISASIDSR